jgi:16S rRNA (uracil1498-N3)-methyltransferase
LSSRPLGEGARRVISPTSPAQRRDVVAAAGIAPFRADQVSRHWFARLDDDPGTWTDLPVADRDRMLWLAEKACELGCTSWRPVLWRRSRSVSPRGEGVAFQQKVMARMTSALAQSEGAWLPQPFPEASLERALLAAPPGDRLVLDPAGTPMVGPSTVPLQEPVVLAIGPEGGIEADELEALAGAGFRSVRLGPTILRFETAAVAALAIARTSLSAASTHRSPLQES